jgi:hypothetical protein
MSAPVPIDVDPQTGIWRTDGLPMLYLPRHFLVNNHNAVAAALGVDAYRAILRPATDKSAFDWCSATSRTLSLTPEAAFRYYFQRLSQRGWGRFNIDELDIPKGTARFSLEYSIFVLETPVPDKAPQCYMFEGFFTGAMRYLLGASGTAIGLECNETNCAADGFHPACCFTLTAKA